MEGTISAIYLRLDYDPNKPGKLFKESHPHIHITVCGAPRIPFIWNRTDNVIAKFLDFICRNYCYEKWINWVELIWERHLASVGPERENAFDTIKQVFTTRQPQSVVEQYKEEIEEIKKCVHLKLDEFGRNLPLLKTEDAKHLIYEI